MKCANCGETPNHWQYVDQTEKKPLKGGRGEACAVIKCKVTSLTDPASSSCPLSSSVAERTPSTSYQTPSPATT